MLNVVDYERKAGLQHGTMKEAVIGQANSSWEQLERGEISLLEFAQKFNDECSEIVSSLIDVLL